MSYPGMDARRGPRPPGPGGCVRTDPLPPAAQGAGRMGGGGAVGHSRKKIETSADYAQ